MPDPAYPSDIVFTPTVKALQQARGSRHAYARMEQGRGWQTGISDDVRGLPAAPGVAASRALSPLAKTKRPKPA